MIVSEIIYTIREKLKSYIDDTRYSDSYLMHLVDLKRAFHIRREYNNYQRNLDADILQTFHFELEKVDDSLARDFVQTDFDIVKTIKPIPDTIELHSKNTITRVGPVGINDTHINHVELNRFPYVGTGKYEKLYVFSTLNTDNHIYLKAAEDYYKGLDYITVSAAFEKPLEAAKFSIETELQFDYYNFNYPIEAWMIEFIITEIVSELSNLNQIKVDTNNNSKDDND